MSSQDCEHQPAGKWTSLKTKAQNAVSCMKSAKKSMEYFVEDPSVVVLFLVVVYIDIILESYVLSGASIGIVIETAHTIILCLQAFELLLQMCLFQTRFFSHWGYAFDSIFLSTRILNEFDQVNTSRLKLHLLSFLRVWRFVRTVQAFTRIEVKELKKKVFVLQENIKREQSISEQNQETVATLQEALRIAAIDVAAARGHGQYDDTNRSEGIIDIDDEVDVQNRVDIGEEINGGRVTREVVEVKDDSVQSTRGGMK